MQKCIQVAFSFDTTGSMMPCMYELKRKITETVETLYNRLEGLQVALIAHGDYCDRFPYDYIPFTVKGRQRRLIEFVEKQKAQGGGDSDEMYAGVLRRVLTDLDWDPKAEKRIFCMIGDDVPHRFGYSCNGYTENWRWENDLEIYASRNIQVYGVQCLGRRYARSFYEKLAEETNGVKIDLQQFSTIVELVEGVIYHQSGQLDSYEQELVVHHRMNTSVRNVLRQVRGEKIVVEALEHRPAPVRRSTSALVATKYPEDTGELEEVPAWRFQVLHVDTDQDIRSFVEESGAVFQRGKGFYQFTKRETVQEYKEVILRDKETHECYTGGKARTMIGLPYGTRGTIRPVDLEKYDIFVQSTSMNRKLKSNTLFLYDTVEK